MEKQTAVMKLLQYILVDCRNKDGIIQFSAHETFNEYLEIEKQQIIDAWEDGHDSFSSFSTRNAEQYHKETFGGKDEQ
jgi:quinol monooxygenase YgiN